ncbi:hypothetical protein PsorP6_014075 [Peronosclerospora sorghi]|uniref:Uncharacterized protein n=1 Tax=Peronosclerospora sorghi TaxID=230839 RepID=A0ACC0VKZ9_9STRA|nr:hypothetical protein PsorP6_014075 [Peronosclerospora sorghi]
MNWKVRKRLSQHWNEHRPRSHSRMVPRSTRTSLATTTDMQISSNHTLHLEAVSVGGFCVSVLSDGVFGLERGSNKTKA